MGHLLAEARFPGPRSLAFQMTRLASKGQKVPLDLCQVGVGWAGQELGTALFLEEVTQQEAKPGPSYRG